MKLHPVRLYLLLLLFAVSSCVVTSRFKGDVTRWEKDIAAFESLDAKESYPTDAILFMGSSSIRRWDNIHEEMKPYPVIQRGFGGCNMADLSWYTRRIVYPHQFRAVVIFIGNEIVNSPDDRSARETTALFREVVKTIREKYPIEPIFLIEVTPTRSRWMKWEEIKRTNAALKSYCERTRNLYFIATASDFLNGKGEPRDELFTNDQLHLNAEGYALWSDLIKKRLNEILQAKN